jgi:hypothetical protein
VSPPVQVFKLRLLYLPCEDAGKPRAWSLPAQRRPHNLRFRARPCSTARSVFLCPAAAAAQFVDSKVCGCSTHVYVAIFKPDRVLRSFLDAISLKFSFPVYLRPSVSAKPQAF